MYRLAWILAILTLGSRSVAQDCDCLANFDWVKETFETNDAGFAYALEQKGESAYLRHNELTRKMIEELEDPDQCPQLLHEWLSWFRSGHIGILRSNQSTGADGKELTNEEIRQQYADWERQKLDTLAFRSYLDDLSQPGYEGIWASGPYKIAVRKSADGYVGTILAADGVYWMPDQVKMRISGEGAATYYMRDHSAQEFDRAELLDQNHLQMGFVLLQRVYPSLPDNPSIARYIRCIEATSTFIERIDDKTLLLRIPSFDGYLRDQIDSVINANMDTLLQTPNLIIDLRNNGGGSDRSYYPILPLLYTGPIHTVGVELLSTPLNNQRMLDFVNNPEYGFSEEEKEWAQAAYEKLSKYPGEFVNLGDHVVDTTTLDTVYPYPKQVAIIIHEGNGSTTEQFLLAARQSKKVKLFGTTTYGVLDISNMYYVDSPCDDFQLGYSLSRSMRLPDLPVDDIGIQPDFFIHREVAPHDWIDFVLDVLK